jgi:hypothetical protein
VRESGVDVVAVVVETSEQRPHFTGHAYIRRGSETVKASPELFDELVATRIDKVRRILQEKGKIVTVEILPKKSSADSGLKPGILALKANNSPRILDCRVDGCDAFVLHFTDVNSGQHYTSPIERVTIDYDGMKLRTKLIIDNR